MQFNGGIGGGGGGTPAVNCQGTGTCSGNGSGNGNCFPANATVLLPGGATKRMDELVTGDAVAVRTPDGSLGYQPIYAWCAECNKKMFEGSLADPACHSNTAAVRLAGM
jgi:hypothetical protein